jgi:hypothetical protein
MILVKKIIMILLAILLITPLLMNLTVFFDTFVVSQWVISLYEQRLGQDFYLNITGFSTMAWLVMLILFGYECVEERKSAWWLTVIIPLTILSGLANLIESKFFLLPNVIYEIKPLILFKIFNVSPSRIAGINFFVNSSDLSSRT